MSRETRAVLFDLDDTLFDHRGTSRQALGLVREAFEAFRRLSLDELERRHAVVLEALHRGVIEGRVPVEEAREERFGRLLAEAGGPDAAGLAGVAAARYRDAYIASRRPVPGGRALLEALAPHARLGIVTNNIRVEQEAKLAELGLRALVDVLVVSAEEGVAKPEPAVFESALTRLGVEAARAVMVGDSWAHDVVGANTAGLRAVWFNRRGEPCPDPRLAIEISTLEPAAEVAATILGTLTNSAVRPATSISHPPGARRARE